VFAQLQRSSLSVQLNIAEGHALRSASRFGYHLTIAYGSAVETIELLELGLEENLFPANVGRPILEASIEARGYLLGLMKRYRRGSHGRG
jgi:four helix bundle protein